MGIQKINWPVVDGTVADVSDILMITDTLDGNNCIIDTLNKIADNETGKVLGIAIETANQPSDTFVLAWNGTLSKLEYVNPSETGDSYKIKITSLDTVPGFLADKLDTAYFKTDGNKLSLVDNLSLPSLTIGQKITQFSTDTTFALNSDEIIPTQKAIMAYVVNNAALKTSSQTQDFASDISVKGNTVYNQGNLKPASVLPSMDNVAAAGSSDDYARADHVHPSDTKKANTDQIMYIGSTQVNINRPSGELILDGVTLPWQSISDPDVYTKSETDTKLQDYLTTSAAADQYQSVANAFGANQTWQDVTTSRTLGTTYVNTTGKAILVHVTCNSTTLETIKGLVNNITLYGSTAETVGRYLTISFIVPNNISYSISSGNYSLLRWAELRQKK